MIQSKIRLHGKDIAVCKIDESESVSFLSKKKTLAPSHENENIYIKEFIIRMIQIEENFNKEVLKLQTKVLAFHKNLVSIDT